MYWITSAVLFLTMLFSFVWNLYFGVAGVGLAFSEDKPDHFTVWSNLFLSFPLLTGAAASVCCFCSGSMFIGARDFRRPLTKAAVAMLVFSILYAALDSFVFDIFSGFAIFPVYISVVAWAFLLLVPHKKYPQLHRRKPMLADWVLIAVLPMLSLCLLGFAMVGLSQFQKWVSSDLVFEEHLYLVIWTHRVFYDSDPTNVIGFEDANSIQFVFVFSFALALFTIIASVIGGVILLTRVSNNTLPGESAENVVVAADRR